MAKKIYTLDEMSIMAKERRIDTDNLQDVMESLKDYDISDENVRYILKEIAESDNIPKEFRVLIDDVLEQVDNLVELNSRDVLADDELAKMDVQSAIIDEAPKIESNSDSSASTSGEESASSSTDTSNVETKAVLEDVVKTSIEQEPIVEEPVPTPETLEAVPLVDVTEQIKTESEEFSNSLPANYEVLEVEATPYIIDGQTQVFSASAAYQENELKMEEVKKLALVKGINVISSKVNPHQPVGISMELTPESKPYLDNLLLQLYGDNKNHLKINLVKDSENGKEMLVMEVNDKDLSFTEAQKYGQEMLTSITEIIETTDKNKDYEALMPPELRDLRDKFHADEPDVIKNSDVEIVTSKEDGQTLYHIAADSREEAKVVAEELGVTIKEDHGGGVFEIDDRNIPDMENTKIGVASKDVNYTDEVKEVKENEGLSDLNINYNNEYFYSETKESASAEIMDFLRESNEDERTMSRITVENYGDQRVVRMSDTNGFNDTVVINEGEGFDRFVLPAIASAFAKDNEVSGSKTYEESGAVGYFGENSKTTQLVIGGYDEQTIDNVEQQIEQSKVQENEINNYNSKAYGKVLGAYPTKGTNSREAANTSFASLLVFIIVVILGLAVVYVVFGG